MARVPRRATRGPCSAGWRRRCATLPSGQEFEQAATLPRPARRGTASASRPRRWCSRRPRTSTWSAIVEDDLEAAFQVFYVRRGRVMGRRGWVVDRVEDLDRPGLIASFLEQLYMERQEVPPRVLVPAMPADARAPRGMADRPPGQAGPDRGPVARGQAAPDGGRRAQRRRGLPAAQAPARLRLRRPIARARRAGGAARPGPGAAADRVLRHLEPRRDRQGRLDGGVRGRPAQAVRTTGSSRSRACPGRTTSPPWTRCSTAGSRACSRSRTPDRRNAGDGSPTRRRSSSWTAGGGSWRGRAGTRRARAVHPAHRAREAAGRGLLPRPSRPARDPARLGGAVRAPAHPRRGAPYR